MTEHRFTKGVMDYGSGAIALVESRVKEFCQKHDAAPALLLLHAPTVRRVFSELTERHNLPPLPQEVVQPGSRGMMGGIPFFVCTCGRDLGEDQIIDNDGNAEPL